MIRKIISGGQTGADFAGLVAGKTLALETGGTAPYNWMTAGGERRTLLGSFGLVAGEYDPKVYPMRTLANVRNSDGTVLFGRMGSPGCRLTIRYCDQEKKPKPYICNPDPNALRNWVKENDIGVLNVAGNREHTNPGIFGVALNAIYTAFAEKTIATETINRFRGNYHFLSNFFIEPDGTFVERDFQAGKATNDRDLQYILAAPAPSEAKKRGRAVQVRRDWDSVKVDLMLRLVRGKFADHPILRTELLATDDALLVEGNWWHDNFWGTCTCPKCGDKGKNMLGIILHIVRYEIRKEAKLV